MNVSVQSPRESSAGKTRGKPSESQQEGNFRRAFQSTAQGSASKITTTRPCLSPNNEAESSSSNLCSSSPRAIPIGQATSDTRGHTSNDDTGDESTSLFSSSNNTSSSNVLTPDTSPASELSDPLARILLVDDNHINLKVLSTYLVKLGLEFDVAMNGEKAVDLFCKPEGRYGCIFMDISMPVMDGFEATTRIRSHEKEQGLGHVPVIGLSGLASDDAHRDSISSGMDMLVTKPVKLKALGNLLESLDILGS